MAKKSLSRKASRRPERSDSASKAPVACSPEVEHREASKRRPSSNAVDLGLAARSYTIGDNIHVRPTTLLAKKIATPERSDCPYALFLGAGASVSSGIDSARTLVNKWKKDLYESERRGRDDFPTFEEWSDEGGFRKWRELREKDAKMDADESDYGALFSYFVPRPSERQTHIENLMKGAKPAFGYLYLAGLVNDKRFNRVLTTNFDDLLNDALIHYYEARPVVYSFDSSVAGARIAGKRPKIIKLHGDFLYDNLKNVRNEVHALESNMEQKLYEACKDSGLVVVGYSGADESIMAPLRDMLRKSGYLTFGLHWCLFIDPDSREPQIDEEVERLARNYRGDVHFYAMPSFDETMEMVFRACRCPLPHALTRPHERSLPKRFYDSVVYGSSNALTQGMHEDLYDIMQRAGKPIDEDEYRVLDAELSWKWGVIARSDERFDEAESWFAEGMEKLHSLVEPNTGRPTADFAKSGSPNAIMLAMRRYAGLLIAQAKLHVALGKRASENASKRTERASSREGATALERLAEVFHVVRNGKQVMEELDTQAIGRHGPDVAGLSPPMRRSLYYQGICAYGVMKRLENRPLTDEEWAEKEVWEAELRRHDEEGSHFAKLKEDADYQPLLDRRQ